MDDDWEAEKQVGGHHWRQSDRRRSTLRTPGVFVNEERWWGERQRSHELLSERPWSDIYTRNYRQFGVSMNGLMQRPARGTDTVVRGSRGPVSSWSVQCSSLVRIVFAILPGFVRSGVGGWFRILNSAIEIICHHLTRSYCRICLYMRLTGLYGIYRCFGMVWSSRSSGRYRWPGWQPGSYRNLHLERHCT